jgi:hypothetical protein
MGCVDKWWCSAPRDHELAPRIGCEQWAAKNFPRFLLGRDACGSKDRVFPLAPGIAIELFFFHTENQA